MSDLFLKVRQLANDERGNALELARAAVRQKIGALPLREEFNGSTPSKYPAWMRRLALQAGLFMFVSAFLPSAIRLYKAGGSTFNHSVDGWLAFMVAGACIVLMAETGTIMFTLMFAILKDSLHGFARFVLVGSIVLCAAISLSGNYQLAIGARVGDVTVFDWLEAIAPTILTLSTAFVVKEMWLQDVAERQQDEVQYQLALDEYKLATSRLEDHPQFFMLYVNELRDALVRANKGTRYWMRDVFPLLQDEEWRALIGRELNAESWYIIEQPQQQLEQPGEAAPVQQDIPLAFPSHVQQLELPVSSTAG